MPHIQIPRQLHIHGYKNLEKTVVDDGQGTSSIKVQDANAVN